MQRRAVQQTSTLSYDSSLRAFVSLLELLREESPSKQPHALHGMRQFAEGGTRVANNVGELLKDVLVAAAAMAAG